MENILIHNFNIDVTFAKKMIPFAEGSIHKVFDLLNNGFDKLLDTSIDILRYAIGRKYNTAIKLFNSTIEGNPKILFQIIIQLIINWIIDVQKARIGTDKIHCVGYEDTIEKSNLKFNYVRLDNLVFELTNLTKTLNYNINLNLLVLNVIFNLSTLSKRS